jgi:hypothetical protein
VGLTILYRIFFTFSLNAGIFLTIMSFPQNFVMDLNNVMASFKDIAGFLGKIQLSFYVEGYLVLY